MQGATVSAPNFRPPTELLDEVPQPEGSSWWLQTSAARLQSFELRMLHAIKYRQGFVAGLNTITTLGLQQSAANSSKEIMVLIHGFAGGLACWAQNWEFLSEHYILCALDLPGFGRSMRPNVTARTPREVLDFFCQCLDDWFGEMRFKVPVILVGHSFGAYIAAHYSMRRGPSCVQLLVFVDPWGVNRRDQSGSKRVPFTWRLALSIANRMNPLTLVRAAGPLGPLFFRLIRPDFANRWRGYLPDPVTFYEYTYHCNAQLPPLGEELFKICYHHDITAKEPLEDELPSSLSKDIPLVLLYGSETWMDAERGTTMADKMEGMGFKVKVDTVMSAGHQVFTDNPSEFNNKLLLALAELLA